jgi:hypothetical protein
VPTPDPSAAPESLAAPAFAEAAPERESARDEPGDHETSCGIAASDRAIASTSRFQAVSAMQEREKFSAHSPGVHLYDPQRRHASPPLRALIDHLRATRGTSRRASGRPPSR